MDAYSSKVLGIIQPIQQLRLSLPLLFALAFAPGLTSSVFAQATPTKEYIRLGDRIIAIENLVGVPTNLAGTSPTGLSMSTTVNTAFPHVFGAKVTDANSNPVTGTPVTFTVVPNGGASGKWSSLTTLTVRTDSTGSAVTATFTANGTVGSYTVTAAVAGVGTAITYNLQNLAGTTGSITATGGTPQQATVNTAFGTTFQATVKDANNNPLSGVSVTFTAPTTGASGTFSSSATVTTNSSGVAISPVFTANTIAGTYNVSASTGGLSTTFSLTNLPGAPAHIGATQGSGQTANTNAAFPLALKAQVTDSFGNQVPNVSVTFAAPAQTGPSGTFSGSATVTTDSTGTATAPTFTANGNAGGPYNVTAMAGSLSVTFSETNLSTSVPIHVNVSYWQNATLGIQNVQVNINGTPQTPVTDANGNFQSPPEPNGTYTISLVYVGSGTGWLFYVSGTPTQTTATVTISNGVVSPSTVLFSAQPITGQSGIQNLNQSFTSNQFLSTIADPSGYSPDFSVAYQLLFASPSPSGSTQPTTTANSCYFFWDPLALNGPTQGNDYAVLATDSGSIASLIGYPVYDATQYFSVEANLPTQFTIRGRPQMHNSQCLLDYFNTYIDFPANSTNVLLYTSLYFFGSFSGTQEVWTRAGSGPWVQPGTWTVPTPEQTSANLAVTSPANNATVTASGFTVSGTVNFTAGQQGIVYVYWDGSSAIGGGQATISGNNFTFTTPAIPAGTYTLTVVTAADLSEPGSNQDANLIGAVAPRITVTAH